MRLKSFWPWTAPLASRSAVDTPSGSSVTVGGRSKRTQCMNVPEGASGSSQINTRLFVVGGMSLHLKSGERSSPSQVYFVGIASPSKKASLVIRMSTVFSTFEVVVLRFFATREINTASEAVV